MKTAISIPDAVFEAAELAAERLAMSRSELYTTAVREFLQTRGRDAVTERLDKVYTEQPSELDPALLKAQSRAIGDSTW